MPSETPATVPRSAQASATSTTRPHPGAPAAEPRFTGAGLPAAHPLRAGLTADSALLNQYRGGRSADGSASRPARRPVWFMRQAGRSLPEYRELREGTTMLESCLDPAMASEITLQPIRRHDVDAAIFFSDIVIPLRLAGIEVEIAPGVGPVFGAPVRSAADVARLPDLDDDAFAPVAEAVGRTVEQLGETPLIGFAGAPFTLAAYMVEGRPSRDHLGPRALMHADPETWEALAGWAADVSGRFMRAQVMAGASAAQLFDSWAGSLGRGDYAAHVHRHSARALSHLADLDIPTVHFGTGTGEILDLLRTAGADVVGVDYRIPLATAAERVGAGTPLQGNIDPALLRADWDSLVSHVHEVVESGASAAGHVLNLGHGVPPDTDPEVLTRLVELIHGIGYPDRPAEGSAGGAGDENGDASGDTPGDASR